MVSHALISGTTASRYHGSGRIAWSAPTGACAALCGGSQNPMTKAPPTAAVVLRNSRRFISFMSVLVVMISSQLALQGSGAVYRLTDAVIGPASACIVHLRINVGV